MINNKDLITPLLQFPKPEDSFYFIQVLQRKKDNPELDNNSRVIKTYFIRSIEHLDKYFKEMSKLAELFNARVSINLNPRNFEKAGFQTISKIAHQMENKDFGNIFRAFESVCGNYHSEIDKRWLVDIDKEQLDRVEKVEQYINLAHLTMSTHEKASNYKILAKIPTLTGLHIICNPFNKQAFSKEFPDVEIHGNNPTLLYYNKL